MPTPRNGSTLGLVSLNYFLGRMKFGKNKKGV